MQFRPKCGTFGIMLRHTLIRRICVEVVVNEGRVPLAKGSTCIVRHNQFLMNPNFYNLSPRVKTPLAMACRLISACAKYCGYLLNKSARPFTDHLQLLSLAFRTERLEDDISSTLLG